MTSSAAPSGTNSAPKSWSSVALGERGRPLGPHSPYQVSLVNLYTGELQMILDPCVAVLFY